MIGKFARSIAGHDKGTLYIVVEAFENKVGLADGKGKTVASPKIKNLKHIEIYNKSVDDEVIDAINANILNVNDVVRLAIKREERNV